MNQVFRIAQSIENSLATLNGCHRARRGPMIPRRCTTHWTARPEPRGGIRTAVMHPPGEVWCEIVVVDGLVTSSSRPDDGLVNLLAVDVAGRAQREFAKVANPVLFGATLVVEGDLQ